MSLTIDRMSEDAKTAFDKHQAVSVSGEWGHVWHCKEPGTVARSFTVTFNSDHIALCGDIGAVILKHVNLEWAKGSLDVGVAYWLGKVPDVFECKRYHEETAKQELAEWADMNDREDLLDHLNELEFESAWWDLVSDISDPPDPMDWTPNVVWCVLAIRWLVAKIVAASKCERECKVCQARCVDGEITHGRGCYHLRVEGGGVETCTEPHP